MQCSFCLLTSMTPISIPDINSVVTSAEETMFTFLFTSAEEAMFTALFTSAEGANVYLC